MLQNLIQRRGYGKWTTKKRRSEGKSFREIFRDGW